MTTDDKLNLVIEIDSSARLQEVYDYAAKRHVTLSVAFAELLNKGLSHLDDD